MEDWDIFPYYLNVQLNIPLSAAYVPSILGPQADSNKTEGSNKNRFIFATPFIVDNKYLSPIIFLYLGSSMFTLFCTKFFYIRHIV